MILDRHDPGAKALLGTVLLELNRTVDARACLAEAVAAEPDNPFFRQGLAEAEKRDGAPAAAAATLAAGVALQPGRPDLRNASILLAIAGHDFAAALDLAEAARGAGAADACGFGLMGHALSSLGRHDEAAEAYAEALKLAPEDPYVRHLVAASGALPAAREAPQDYVRAVFDGSAGAFERQLIGLGYRVPGLVRAALLAHGPEAARQDAAPGRIPVGPLLDLGCGTGLVGVVLAGLNIGPLIGIDISAGMLAEAAAKAMYAELRQIDLLRALAEDQRAYPLIVAADVLCYMGALEQAFTGIAARLAPGGICVLSAEALGENDLPDIDWALGRLGRYAHSRRYLEETAAAAGLRIIALSAEPLRFEDDQPVAGFLMVLTRPDAGAA